MLEVGLAVTSSRWLECCYCQGEGYLLTVGRPGAYSRHDAAFLPSETLSPCPECDGGGEIEVCGTCLEPFVIKQGKEACGCTALQLRKAA